MTESIDPSDDDVVARRDLETTRDAPAIQLTAIVADLEGDDVTDIEPIYNRIDELLRDLFSTPPVSAAEATLEFTYEGYRITVRQNGTAVFRRVSA